MGDAPTQVDSYRILGKLGEGGMGTVYEAVPGSGAPHVAIKILHPEHARSEEFLARFFNEARAVRDVDHRGLVQVSDVGKLPDGTAYIVMELLTGESLAARLKRSRGALPVADVLRLGAQIADTLAAAHDKGIVHRDLKPENIMVVPDTRVAGGEQIKLLDFGIAKLTDGEDFVKTRTNAMLGTPLYMSPEQCRGAGRVDDRADVYSFGVLLFVMVAGRPPFSGEGMGEIMGKHMYEEAPQLEDFAPEVPAPLADLVSLLLSKERQHRPPMRGVVAELTEMAIQLAKLPKKPDRTTGPNRTPPVTAGVTLGNLAGQTTVSTRPWSPLKQLGAALAVLVVVVPPVAVLPILLGRKLPAATPPEATASAPAWSPPRKVRWRIDSQPAGASVTRESDGELLCMTPCLHEQLPARGMARLRIGSEGYVDKRVELAQDSDGTLAEILEPAPQTAKNKKPAAPTKSAKSGPANAAPGRAPVAPTLMAKPTPRAKIDE